MLKVNEIYESKILSLDFKADGVVKINDTFIYIKGALPNEVVKFKINKLNKRFGFAEIVEIIEKSKDRADNLNELGSLNLSHLSFLKQLTYQKDITKQTFDKVLNKDVNVLNTITDNNKYNYRNKVVFHLLNKDEITLGLYKNDNKTLIKVNNFLIANKYSNELIELINNSKIKVDYLALKHISIKNNSNNELLVTLISYKEKFKGLNELINLIKSFNKVIGITLNIKESNNKILGTKSILLYGSSYLKENDLLITDKSFYQTNFNVANLTFNLIKENILGNNIVDLYSGIGSIILNVLKDDYNAYMVENNEENIKLAKTIIKNKNINNLKIIKANSEDVFNDLTGDTLIVDPPRVGLYKDLVLSIKKSNFKRLIYLSCNLQTLVRDIKLLNNSYNIDKVYPVKMFPQTSSFETLVILTKL